MSDLVWGLEMMLIGMGIVFGLLLALMVLLILIGRTDRPKPAPAAEELPPAPASAAPTVEAPGVRIVADGLDENQLAAIAVAVITHADIRRRSAAPEARAHAPGSQLFASRWVSIGRSHQQAPFRRR